ncbi:MAG: hypothetical protein R6X13_03930, partial [bacterium]
SDGSNYLVAWTDMRHRSTKPDIYCNRVYQSGMTRDSAALQVCRAPGVQDSIRLAYCRGRYLAVWLDRRTGQREIYAARLDSTGRKIDTADIRIAGGHVQGLAVCAGDSNWLVAWCGLGHSQLLDVKATAVSLSGDVSHPDGTSITFTNTSEFWPAVAFDGHRFHVCWHTYRNIQTSYEVAGVVLPPDSLSPSAMRYISNKVGGDELVALTRGYDCVLAVWLNEYPSNYRSVLATRLDTSGVPLDSPPITLALVNRSFGAPMSVFFDSYYYVLWQWKIDNVRWYYGGARLTTGGGVMDTFALAPSESTRWSVGLGAADDQALLVYPKVIDSIGGIRVELRRMIGLQSPFGDIEETGPASSQRAMAMPNPFRSTTRLAIPRLAGQAVDVFNAAGRKVKMLTPDAAGNSAWLGDDECGRTVAPGVYFASAGDGEAPLRLVRLR